MAAEKPTKPKSKSSETADKKSFDFVHPDKAMPSASAKPIIVTHRAVIKDPMMSEVPESAVASPGHKFTPTEKTVTKTAPTIGEMAARVHAKSPEKEEPEEEKAEVLTEKPQEPTITPPESAEEPAETPVPSKPEKPKPPLQEEPAPSESESEEVSKDADEHDSREQAEKTEESDEISDLEKNAPDKAAATKPLENKTNQAIEAMVESRQYFVPINTVKKRRSKQAVAVVLVLAALGAAGAAYYMLYIK